MKIFPFFRISFFFSFFIFFFDFISLADHRTPSSNGHLSTCKFHYPSDVKVEWKCRRLKKGDTLEKLFGERWEDVVRFNRIDRRHAYPGVYLKIPTRLEEIESFTPMPIEYPPAQGKAKFILIDLSEQFLAGYEYGRRVLSSPITSGEKVNDYETPTGEFKVTAAHRSHKSSLYPIEDTKIPYPMNYALQFYVTKSGISYWLHGRDVPGYPASHGCIGLYNEAMQKEYYGFPHDPLLEDARILYKWVLGPFPDSGNLIQMKDGPGVLIIGQPPQSK